MLSEDNKEHTKKREKTRNANCRKESLLEIKTSLKCKASEKREKRLRRKKANEARQIRHNSGEKLCFAKCVNARN